MTAQNDVANPDISVVVCTRNRAALLRGALASLYDLATEDEFTYEIVVVDNGSTDETPQVITAAMKESKHPLRALRHDQPGNRAARHRGIDAARGKWIAFFDDDELADWHWLAELFRGAQENNSRVVGGSVQLALPAECKRQLDPSAQMVLGESMAAELPLQFSGRLAPSGGNLMIERSVLDDVRQLEPEVAAISDYSDLYFGIERANIGAWFIPTAIVHRLTPAERLERNSLLRLARCTGQGYAVRQLAALGAVRFAGLWMANCLHLVAVQYPIWLWATLRREDEWSLGRSCDLAITQGFLLGADNSSNAEGQRDKRAARAAPVYILRSGEPTAVMEVSQLALSPSAPKLPSR
jgi:hypothetical protein